MNKQIEDMAYLIYKNRPIMEMWVDKADAIAEMLYKNGYRKQSEGKWKWMHGCAGYGIYCTNCGAGWKDHEDVELLAYSHDYCPLCGAHMHKDNVNPIRDYEPVGKVKIIKKFVVKGGE